MGNINRKYIYLLAALMVVIPVMRPMGLPISLSPEVAKTYEVLKQVPDGGTILMGFDYHVGPAAELQPQAAAILNLMATKNVKVVTFTCFAESSRFPESCLETTYGAAGKVYGTDYVNLGYYAGGEASLAAFCENVRGVYKSDSRGDSLDSLPLMKSINGINDFDMAISVNSTAGLGTTPEMWIRQVNVAYKKPLVLGVQSVTGPAAISYLQAKSIDGLLIGLNAAAEMEKISNKPGSAIASMDALTLAHLMIVVLLVLGNLGYIVDRRSRNGSVPREGGVSK